MKGEEKEEKEAVLMEEEEEAALKSYVRRSRWEKWLSIRQFHLTNWVDLHDAKSVANNNNNNNNRAIPGCIVISWYAKFFGSRCSESAD